MNIIVVHNIPNLRLHPPEIDPQKSENSGLTRA